MLFFSKNFGLSAGFCLQILLRAQFTYFVRINIYHQINRHFFAENNLGFIRDNRVPLWNFAERLFKTFSPRASCIPPPPAQLLLFLPNKPFQPLMPEISKTTDETVRKHETVTRAISGELSHFIIAPFTRMIKKWSNLAVCSFWSHI